MQITIQCSCQICGVRCDELLSGGRNLSPSRCVPSLNYCIELQLCTCQVTSALSWVALFSLLRRVTSYILCIFWSLRERNWWLWLLLLLEDNLRCSRILSFASQESAPSEPPQHSHRSQRRKLCFISPRPQFWKRADLPPPYSFLIQILAGLGFIYCWPWGDLHWCSGTDHEYAGSVCDLGMRISDLSSGDFQVWANIDVLGSWVRMLQADASTSLKNAWLPLNRWRALWVLRLSFSPPRLLQKTPLCPQAHIHCLTIRGGRGQRHRRECRASSAGV